jgi:hypothetical protein
MKILIYSLKKKKKKKKKKINFNGLLVMSLFQCHICKYTLNYIDSISKLSTRYKSHKNYKGIFDNCGRMDVSVADCYHGNEREIKS